MDVPRPPDMALPPLLQRLQRVRSRRAGLALAIWGEAGVGKSHLLTRLSSALPFGLLKLHASVPLAELAQAIPAGPRLPTWVARNLERLRAGQHASPGPTLIAALSAMAPVALALEDLHEAEPERSVLVEELAAVVRRSRGVALLTSSRHPPSTAFDGLRLLPLEPAGSEALLQNHAGAGLPPEATAWIYARAKGNALFSLAYFRLLADTGHLWNDGRRWRWRAPAGEPMPLTVEALIEMQLSPLLLDQTLAKVIRSRAVLAHGVSDGAWAEVAGLPRPTWLQARAALERAGVIVGEAFVHPLYGEVVLRSLPEDEHRSMARTALAALDHDPTAAVAYLEAAGLDAEERSQRYLAAEAAARAASDAPAAARHLAKAAECAEGEASGALALGAAQALMGVDIERAAHFAERAASRLSDPSEALRSWSLALATLGRHQEAQVVLGRMPGPFLQSLDGFQHRIALLYTSARHQDLLVLWRANPSLHGACDVTTVHRIIGSYIACGQLDDATSLVSARTADDGLSHADRAELEEMHSRLCFFHGDYAKAKMHIDEALRLVPDALPQKRAGWLRNRAVMLQCLAEVHESMPDLEEALSAFAEAGNSIYYAQTLVMISHAHFECGDYDRTQERLEEALDIFRRVDPQPFHINALALLVEVCVHRDSAPHRFLARKYADEAVAVCSELGDAESEAVTALLLASVAQEHEALKRADEALGKWLEQGGTPEGTLNAYVLRAKALERAGRPEEALRALDRAKELAREHGLIGEEHKVGLNVDRLRGDRASAMRRLAWFEDRGLGHGANLALRAFPAPAGASAPAVKTPVLWLQVLGPMQMAGEGGSASIRGPKRRDLLAALLSARITGRSEVTQLELLDLLYPGDPEAAAATALKQLVFQMRKRWGQTVLVSTANGYALGHVASDAEDFLRSGETGAWRGPCLHEVDGERCEVARSLLYHALAQAADRLLGHDPLEAVRLARLLMEADPYDLNALDLTLRALQAAGDGRAIERVYSQACLRLAEMGTVMPELWESFLSRPRDLQH